MVVVRRFILPQPTASTKGRSPSVLCVSARVITRLREANGFERRVRYSVQFVFLSLQVAYFKFWRVRNENICE